MGADKVIKDVVVLLPGIMGSTLAKDGNLVWAPSAGSALTAIRTFGRSIHDMKLPDGIGDENPNDGVRPVALMPDLHLLPGIWSAHFGYDELLNWLRRQFHFIEPNTEGTNIPNLLPIAYDWRLSNRYNGRRLKTIVEPALERWRAQGGMFTDAKLIFICHSMGGLVARWFIEMEGGAGITRKLITLGTPYRGALNALDQLVNGVKAGIGPMKLDLTNFARSLPSVHQLLPEYACINSSRGLLKTIEADLPNLNTSMVTDAMMFHDEMDEAAKLSAGALDIHPIVGTRQLTFTTANIVQGNVNPVETIGEENPGGDATVPRLAAIPKQLRPDSPVIRYVADQHSSLQNNQAVLDEIEGILTAKPVSYRAVKSQIEIGIKIEQIVLLGETITVEATVSNSEPVALQVSVINEQGNTLKLERLRGQDGVHRAEISSLPPGAYRIIVSGVGAMSTVVLPVSTIVLVWG